MFRIARAGLIRPHHPTGCAQEGHRVRVRECRSVWCEHLSDRAALVPCGCPRRSRANACQMNVAKRGNQRASRYRRADPVLAPLRETRTPSPTPAVPLDTFATTRQAMTRVSAHSTGLDAKGVPEWPREPTPRMMNFASALPSISPG